MIKKQNSEDFSRVESRLKELNEKIPVPKGATAEKLAARIKTPAKNKLPSFRWAFAAAGLAVVCLGAFLWSRTLVVNQESSEGANPADVMTVAESQGVVEEYGDMAKRAVGETAGAGQNWRPANDFEEIKGLILSADDIGETQNHEVLSSAEDTPPEKAPLEDMTLKLGGISYSAEKLGDNLSAVAVYSVDGGETARLELDFEVKKLILSDSFIAAAGENQNESAVAVIDISAPLNPFVAREIYQDGKFVTADIIDGGLCLGSVYEIDESGTVDASVSDSLGGEKALKARQILISDGCESAAMSVLSVVAPPFDSSEIKTVAALGCDRINISEGAAVFVGAGGQEDLILDESWLQG